MSGRPIPFARNSSHFVHIQNSLAAVLKDIKNAKGLTAKVLWVSCRLNRSKTQDSPVFVGWVEDIGAMNMRVEKASTVRTGRNPLWRYSSICVVLNLSQHSRWSRRSSNLAIRQSRSNKPTHWREILRRNSSQVDRDKSSERVCGHTERRFFGRSSRCRKEDSRDTG